MEIQNLNETMIVLSTSGGAAHRQGVQVGDKIIKVRTC